MDVSPNASQHQCDVLVIDDDIDTLDLVLAFLSKKGIQARGLSNSTDFIGAIRDILPRILLLDVNIPGCNGYDLCHEIKGDQSLSKILVYFMTAMPPTDVSRHVHPCKADGFIPKPFSLHELANLIERLIIQ